MSEKLEKVMMLFNKAGKDYRASEVLFNTDERDFHCDVICFHCQQCVEKSLKAFLMFNETAFPKTHDLLILLNLCSNLDNNFNNFDLSDFSGFGVDIRYDDISATIDETKNAFETAKSVMDYVKNYIEQNGEQ